MVELDKDSFEEIVLKAEGYVFVDFYGKSCAYCQALMPKVREFEGIYGGQMKFTALDTAKARRLAMGQKVIGLPVLAVYKDGAKIDELVKEEAVPENIEAMIKKYI